MYLNIDKSFVFVHPHNHHFFQPTFSSFLKIRYPSPEKLSSTVWLTMKISSEYEDKVVEIENEDLIEDLWQ